MHTRAQNISGGQLDPLYPVQVVPQLEISIARRDVRFAKPEVRVYLHPFGYLATFRTELAVLADRPAISGFALARIINNLERNPTLRVAARAFRGASRLNVLFERLFDCVSQQMFSNRVRVASLDESFCCLDLSGNDLPDDAQLVRDSPEIMIELASALNRHTGNLPPADYDICKLGTVETGRERKSGAASGWSFSAERGFATYIKPGINPQHAQRAAGCLHGNVAKHAGFLRLYQGLLNTAVNERLPTLHAPVLQAALDGYDLQAIAFSKWWARWGTAVLNLDEPVRRVEQAYGLDRRYAHDRNAKESRIGNASPESRARVFISYSHSNEKFFKRLRIHLKDIERELKDLIVWADDRIKPGQMWRDRISMAIEQADIAILLLSADFFASDFITENELPSLLTKKDAGRMTILTLAISSFGEIKGSYAEQVQAIQGINSADRPLLKMRVAEREETYKAAALRVAELLGIDDSGDTGEARKSGG